MIQNDFQITFNRVRVRVDHQWETPMNALVRALQVMPPLATIIAILISGPLLFKTGLKVYQPGNCNALNKNTLFNIKAGLHLANCSLLTVK